MYTVVRSHTYLSAVNADSDAGMEPTSWLLFKSQYLLTGWDYQTTGTSSPQADKAISAHH
jgi:hypothetical protein